MKQLNGQVEKDKSPQSGVSSREPIVGSRKDRLYVLRSRCYVARISHSHPME